MKKAIFILSAIVISASSLSAQERIVDSTLLGKNIMSVMPSEVKVHQSQAISNALNSQTASNSSRNVQVYRVRIFNDNKQTARAESESVVSSFKAAHPGISVYRTYATPFFRVTVGDFRTKSEALKLQDEIRNEYSSMIIIKENVQFPLLNSPVTHELNKEIGRK